jgi:hypothetical protein
MYSKSISRHTIRGYETEISRTQKTHLVKGVQRGDDVYDISSLYQDMAEPDLH